VSENKQLLEKKMNQKNKLQVGDFMKMNVNAQLTLQMEKEKVNQLRVDKLNLDKKLNQMRELNSEKIYYLEEEMALVKSELAFIRNIQKEYYEGLLLEGTDIR